MSRIQGITLLVTITLTLLVAPNASTRTSLKPAPATTAASQASENPTDWCCLAGLACCVPDSK
ncbi:MAG TPA: hypothetical protein VF762_17120 [Blastocatellia bacterium]